MHNLYFSRGSSTVYGSIRVQMYVVLLLKGTGVFYYLEGPAQAYIQALNLTEGI
jgi:hypothetical protein